MDLANAINKISDQVKSQRHLMTTEQATINVAVHPFIRALGYDTNNLQEVRPEYTADAKSSGSERVDYAIMRQGKPIIFIEAKAANIALSENHWKQLHHYFNAEDVRFGILTNGLEFRFYSDLRKPNIMDQQPYMSIDILNLEARLVNELEAFTKAGFDAARIMANAKKRLIARSLQQEMKSPSDDLVRLVARQVHSGQVHDSDLPRYASLVRLAWREVVEAKALRLGQQSFSREEYDTQDVVAEPVSSDFVEIPVRASYKGHRFNARLRYDTTNWKKSVVRLDEGTFKPSESTLQAINTVNPSLTNPQNGWTFWKLRDPSSNVERPMGDLRSDKSLVRRLQGNT